MKQLSGLDAAFVHQESRRTPMHVTAVLIYDTGVSGESAISRAKLTSLVKKRLSHIQVFRRQLQQVPLGLDAPYWVDVNKPDIGSGISEQGLREGGNWRDFQSLLADLHGHQLSLKEPLWEVHLIHGLDHLEGLPDYCQAVILKMHHAAVDGMSMAAIIDSLHRETEVSTVSTAANPDLPGDWEIWSRANLNFASRQRKLASTIQNLLPGLARARETSRDFSDLPALHRGRSHFNRRVSPLRSTGALLFPLDIAVNIRRAVRRVTLNDIALTCVGGALNRYLSTHGSLTENSLACGAPISLRSSGDGGDVAGNKIATMVVGLATNIEDPVERLRMVHRYAVAGKKTISALGSGTVMDISDSLTPGVLAEGIRTVAWASQYVDVPVPFHTMVSNVPGPQGQVSLNEAKLTAALGLGPVRDNLGLFHIVSSSDSLMSISFNACGKIIPDPEFYEQCLRESFYELHACAIGGGGTS